MAAACHQLGVTAQARGRLDEADAWYDQALTLSQQCGDQPAAAMTTAQLGLLARQRDQPRDALRLLIRSVNLYAGFPGLLPDTVPHAIARLIVQFGTGALETAWEEENGSPLPPGIRDSFAGLLPDAKEPPS